MRGCSGDSALPDGNLLSIRGLDDWGDLGYISAGPACPESFRRESGGRIRNSVMTRGKLSFAYKFRLSGLR